MTRVLVAYATKHNSTAEIAAAIGDVLRQSEELEVSVEAVSPSIDISGFDAVVVGSAVYMGQWQPEAAEFLRRHEQALAQLPVWLFSSGPVGEGDPRKLMNGWVFPESLQPVADNIIPRDMMLFHGKLDPSWLNVFDRISVKFVSAKAGDARDWKAIRAWAKRIADALTAK